MGDHGGGSGGTRQGLLVTIVCEDRRDTRLRTRPAADGAPAGGFEAARAIAVAPPHDAPTGAEALLGMRPRGENGFDPLGGSLARFRRPEHAPVGRPFGIGLVGRGQVCGHRAVAALEGRPLRAGPPCARVEECDALRTETDRELRLDHGVGHGVGVAVDCDVGVDVDTHQWPRGILRGRGGQGSESGTVQGLAHALA
jgi:hypothetical protein